MANLGPGDSPWLRREAISKLVQANRAEIYESGAYSVSQLFLQAGGGQAKLVSAEQIRTPILTETRTPAPLHTQPQDPDRIDADSESARLHRILYQRVFEPIKQNDWAKMVSPGILNPQTPLEITAQAAKAEADRLGLNKLRALTHALLRSWHIWCCKALQSGTSDGTGTAYNLKVDGVTVPFETGIVAVNATANWDTASTDITYDLARFMDLYEDQAGRRPTDIIYSGKLGPVFAANEGIREVAAARKIASVTSFPVELINEDYAGIRFHRVTGHYKPTKNGAKTYFWNQFKMTFLNLGDVPGDVLDAGTLPTEDDDFQGSFFGDILYDRRSGMREALAGHNMAPIIGDATQIMTFNLHPNG